MSNLTQNERIYRLKNILNVVALSLRDLTPVSKNVTLYLEEAYVNVVAALNEIRIAEEKLKSEKKTSYPCRNI